MHRATHCRHPKRGATDPFRSPGGCARYRRIAALLRDAGRTVNAKLRDALLDGEIVCSLAEAKIVIESWRKQGNTERPHSSPGDRPPAPHVSQ